MLYSRFPLSMRGNRQKNKKTRFVYSFICNTRIKIYMYMFL